MSWKKELKSQAEYARKRKQGGDTRAVWDRVISRSQTALSRQPMDKVSTGTNVEAANKPSMGERLARTIGSLKLAVREKNVLQKKVVSKTRPK